MSRGLGDVYKRQLYDRYEPFRLGQFSYAAALFFLTFIAACLVCAARVLDARRFSEGGAA